MKTGKKYCQWHETMETSAECSMKPTINARPEHTPTPWIVEQAYGEKEIWLSGNNQDLICRLKGGLNGDLQNAKANAAFIVRAVNAHEKLIKALKGFLFSFDDICKTTSYQEALQVFCHAKAQARELIAEAKGR